MEGRLLREVTVKIGLERIDMQKEITVEALLDSRTIGLVISRERTKIDIIEGQKWMVISGML